jgi:hypothetical protein
MRRMNSGMQAWGIGRMIAGTRVNNEMFDISAHIDRTLSYGENRQNISSMLGINQRNRGLEEYNLDLIEHERARQRRAGGMRQTERGLAQDLNLFAMKPGKRISKEGHRYYENRPNRCDRDGAF